MKAFGKGSAAHRRHLAVEVRNCSQKETHTQNGIPPKYEVVMYGPESRTRKKAEELMFLNCGVEKDSKESLG